MSNVQEAFKSIYGEEPHELESILDREEARGHFERGYEAALSEIEKCEPVGEVVMVHEPEWMKPREGFKWNRTEFPLGTKFYTSPQPRDWVGLSKSVKKRLWIQSDMRPDAYADLLEAKLKQLNTKG